MAEAPGNIALVTAELEECVARATAPGNIGFAGAGMLDVVPRVSENDAGVGVTAPGNIEFEPVREPGNIEFGPGVGVATPGNLEFGTAGLCVCATDEDDDDLCRAPMLGTAPWNIGFPGVGTPWEAPGNMEFPAEKELEAGAGVANFDEDDADKLCAPTPVNPPERIELCPAAPGTGPNDNGGSCPIAPVSFNGGNEVSPCFSIKEQNYFKALSRNH